MAVAAYIFHAGRLLLLRRANPPHTLAPPGGRLDINEDPLAGLHREIGEETGLTVHVLGVAHVWFGSVDGVQAPLLCINYLAETDDCRVRVSAEHSEIVWASREQIASGEIQTLTAGGHGYQPRDILSAFDRYSRRAILS